MEATRAYDHWRVDCRRCGVRVELVPWAEPGSRFTRDFEDQVAYLAQVMDQTTVCRTMRIAWTTVGESPSAWSPVSAPPIACLEHIGIDELSHRRHHEYITTIVDHVARKVVWAAPGKNAATVDGFFEALGPERAAQIKTVTIDMSAA
jgi:transposase